MGYKFKPNKSVAKRFRVTGTGKLKRSKGFHSHLMSARDAKQRRGLHRDDVLHEGHARNMRDMMGIKKLKPAKVTHNRKAREVAEKKAAAAGVAPTAQASRAEAKTARIAAAKVASETKIASIKKIAAKKAAIKKGSSPKAAAAAK